MRHSHLTLLGAPLPDIAELQRNISRPGFLVSAAQWVFPRPLPNSSKDTEKILRSTLDDRRVARAATRFNAGWIAIGLRRLRHIFQPGQLILEPGNARRGTDCIVSRAGKGRGYRW